jgi:hypothetical protein
MTINFEQVHNYYERLVLEDVIRLSYDHPEFDDDMLTDVACIALNRLPARYVRHDVDLMFFLTEQERQIIDQWISEALAFGFALVAERTGSTRRTVAG